MNGSDEGDFSEENCFQHRLGFSYNHCSNYSPIFNMSSFFHDGVNEAFAESVGKCSLFFYEK